MPDTQARPIRLRLSRAKGFSLQRHSMATNGLPAVKVDRSSGLGNPFRIRKFGRGPGSSKEELKWVLEYGDSVCGLFHTKAEAQSASVRMFSAFINQTGNERLRHEARRVLKAHNAACWCSAAQPCHADVLLKLAAREPANA